MNIDCKTTPVSVRLDKADQAALARVENICRQIARQDDLMAATDALEAAVRLDAMQTALGAQELKRQAVKEEAEKAKAASTPPADPAEDKKGRGK